MSENKIFTAKATANATSQTNTTPTASVTSEASATATSTKSYNDAYKKAENIAQNIANSNAQNDANIITESVNLTQRVIQSNYIPVVPTGSTGTFLLNDSNGNTYDDPSLLSFNYNKILTTGSEKGNPNRNFIVGGNLIPANSFDPSGNTTGYSLGNPENRWNQLWLDGGTLGYGAGTIPGSNPPIPIYGTVSFSQPPFPYSSTNPAFILTSYTGSSQPTTLGNALIIGNGQIDAYFPGGTGVGGGGFTGTLLPLINPGLTPNYPKVAGGYYAMPNYGLKVGKGSNIVTITTAGQLTGLNFNATSDHRIKEHVTTLDNTFNVDYLNPVTYTNAKTNKKDIGLIAHELQEHYPELVTGVKDGEEMQTVNYIGLVPILINEIKNIKNNIVKLEDRISELEK